MKILELVLALLDTYRKTKKNCPVVVETQDLDQKREVDSLKTDGSEVSILVSKD